MSTVKEKTIGQLVKEHPDKSYRDLERYRDADRMEEAQRIPVTESRQKQAELEPIEGEEESLQKELGACITAGMKRDRTAIELQQRKKSKIEELDNSLAIALEINEEHQRYNGKLQERLTELEEENKKLYNTLNKKIDDVRKAGL
jgi:thermostable 8-oxoguanine DNA glycosylase